MADWIHRSPFSQLGTNIESTVTNYFYFFLSFSIYFRCGVRNTRISKQSCTSPSSEYNAAELCVHECTYTYMQNVCLRDHNGNGNIFFICFAFNQPW